jgi:hypothetical protein
MMLNTTTVAISVLVCAYLVLGYAIGAEAGMGNLGWFCAGLTPGLLAGFGILHYIDKRRRP